MRKIISEYVKVGNSRLFYSMTGEGKPLVLIHGNFNDSRIWDYQIEYFAKYYKVIWYDLRGYGNSDTPISAFSHFEDLKALFDSLGLEKVTIIGSSLGGSIAVDFALQYPQSVKALVLVAPSVNGYRYPMRITFEALISIILLKFKGFETAINQFINNPFWKYLLPPQHRQEAREKVLQIVRTQKNFYSWNLNLAIPLQPFAGKRLGEILMPALIVLSDMDKDFNKKIGEKVYEEIERSKKVVMSGCGHLPFIERPEEFNRAVLEFLKEVV